MVAQTANKWADSKAASRAAPRAPKSAAWTANGWAVLRVAQMAESLVALSVELMAACWAERVAQKAERTAFC